MWQWHSMPRPIAQGVERTRCALNLVDASLGSSGWVYTPALPQISVDFLNFVKAFVVSVKASLSSAPRGGADRFSSASSALPRRPAASRGGADRFSSASSALPRHPWHPWHPWHPLPTRGTRVRASETAARRQRDGSETAARPRRDGRDGRDRHSNQRDRLAVLPGDKGSTWGGRSRRPRQYGVTTNGREGQGDHPWAQPPAHRGGVGRPISHG